MNFAEILKMAISTLQNTGMTSLPLSLENLKGFLALVEKQELEIKELKEKVKELEARGLKEKIAAVENDLFPLRDEKGVPQLNEEQSQKFVDFLLQGPDGAKTVEIKTDE